jgi:hypothetical protein
MDYARIYDQLIEKFRLCVPDGYTEEHHIKPRCLGGGNEAENLVRLPSRCHFVAHLLLAKMHGGKLIYAAWLMRNSGRYTSRKYEWLQRCHSELRRATKNTPEYCAKMSEALSGEKNYWYGKTLSAEHKAKLRKPKTISDKVIAARLAITGKPLSDERRRKISEGQKGRKMSPETIAKSIAGRRRNGTDKHTEATKAKMRANHADFRGEKHPQYGKKASRESVAKAVATRRKNGSYGFSPDALKKAAEARRLKRARCKLNALIRMRSICFL